MKERTIAHHLNEGRSIFDGVENEEKDGENNHRFTEQKESGVRTVRQSELRRRGRGEEGGEERMGSRRGGGSDGKQWECVGVGAVAAGVVREQGWWMEE